MHVQTAAPELLEALEKLMIWASDNDIKIDDDVFTLARLALLKAKTGSTEQIPTVHECPYTFVLTDDVSITGKEVLLARIRKDDIEELKKWGLKKRQTKKRRPNTYW